MHNSARDWALFFAAWLASFLITAIGFIFGWAP